MTTLERWAPELRRMSYEPGAAARPRAGHSSGPPPSTAAPRDTDLAATRAQIGELVRLALEVYDGRRPQSHLRHVFAPRALRYWRAATGQRRSRGAPSRVLRIVVGRPRARVVETAAVCLVDGRVRALAARFEHDRRWTCTEIRLLAGGRARPGSPSSSGP